MDKTTIHIPSELHAELKAIARRTGRPQAEIIRDALTAYVARQERPWPKSIGIGESDSVRGADYEDLLRQRWKPEQRIPQEGNRLKRRRDLADDEQKYPAVAADARRWVARVSRLLFDIDSLP